MATSLPSRPNLDHLRKQAKALLSALADGDPAAVDSLRAHLPTAASMTPAQIRAAGFRLADAQSAIARQSGFHSWPHLSRHVDVLRALEGTWTFLRLEIGGQQLPVGATSASRILIDGDRFRTESPEAIYEGTFNIDVEAQPHRIDIEFVQGPEAGNTNRGIFRLDSDRLEICLDMHGGPAPAEFRTLPGSAQACELLARASSERPDSVAGGRHEPAPLTPASATAADFPFVDSPLLQQLQGEWTAVQITRDGQSLPPMMLKTATRTATANRIQIRIGGQTIIDALVRYNHDTSPIEVDYLHTAGPAKGSIQPGIMRWHEGHACFCMAAPGQPRPDGFESTPGSGRTLSIWQVKS